MSPEKNSLKEQLRNILEEARTILPGIQALFGFQTVAVFNQRFDALSTVSKYSHVLALALIIVSIALVMAPAAWHRLVEPHQASEFIVAVSSRFLCVALFPLALGIALDTFVVLELVGLNGQLANALASALVLAGLLLVWFVLPLRHRRGK